MGKSATVKSNCPYCHKEITTKFTMPDGSTPPPTRCKNLSPTGHMWVYRISSDVIREYLTEKVRLIVPNAKLDLAPRYCERKKRAYGDGHAYAAINIALSEDVIAGSRDWFGSIGTDMGDVRLVPNMFEDFVARYRYDPKTIAAILKDYTQMEILENHFGITEDYLNEMKKFGTPQRVTTDDGKSWIFFSAAPEKIITNMMTDPQTKTIVGTCKIQDVYPLSKEVVEYLVYLNPTEMQLHEDHHVRQILMGEEKIKK